MMSTQLSELDIECSSLAELLRRRASHQPDSPGYTFLLDGETEEATLTYSELDARARAIAARLQQVAAVGDRALLLYQPGLEFIAAFFGCLYAGLVAVPVYPPRLNRNLHRLQSIIANAQAALALTTTSVVASVQRQSGEAPALGGLRWLTTDDTDVALAAAWREHTPGADAPAFLQYTSGSTGAPKGVVLTHGNLLHNSELIKCHFEHSVESSAVIWLPPYHDMGLIGGLLQPLYCGFPVTLLSPFAFLQRPVRWLQAMTRTRSTTSGGPNFAYELCVQKVTPEQKEALDLSSWDLAFCGAEPVRARTLTRFAEAFESCGFRREALYPCYGLAEATLMVTGGEKAAPPSLRPVRAAPLSLNRVETAAADEDGAHTLVSCGRMPWGQELRIVDPQSLVECRPDEVGEIFVQSPSVAKGYWGCPEESARTFGAHLADTGEGPFLRTGDLGFIKDGELFVVGRIKDLIIISGRNHHPQDIELVVEQSHPALRTGCGAAFGVEWDGEERLVVVHEVERRYRELDLDEVVRAIRRAVSEEHQVQAHSVALVKHGSILKTSSGKIQRHSCRAAFLAGTLDVLGGFNLEAARPAVAAEPQLTTV